MFTVACLQRSLLLLLNVYFTEIMHCEISALHMLYKHITQKKNHTHVIRKRNLTTSLLFQNSTTCFGPYGPSSGDMFEDFLLYCDNPASLHM
jgi:hypothetical protein